MSLLIGEIFPEQITLFLSPAFSRTWTYGHTQARIHSLILHEVTWNDSLLPHMAEFACTACRARPCFYADSPLRKRNRDKARKGGREGREREKIGKRLHLGRFYTDILFLLSRLPRAEHVDFRVGHATGTKDAHSRKINVATLHRTFARVEFMTIERSSSSVVLVQSCSKHFLAG